MDLNFAVTDINYVLGLCGVFVGVFLFAAAVNHFVIEPIFSRRQMAQRLKGNKREQEVRALIFKAYQDTQKSPVLALVEQLTGWGKIENLQTKLFQADVYVNPSTFLSIVGIMGCGGMICGLMMGKFMLALGLGFCAGMIPFMFLRWKRRRKANLFEKQMPEAMEGLARSLRAGHTLAGTLELVSHETRPPLGTEMRITYEEQRLGLSMNQALRRMGDRVDSWDLKYFVTAVLIQSETGGNLAEILENIGFLIRERMKLKGKVQGLTAEGRFSALILGLLPVGVFGILFFVNRSYVMSLFHDPMGTKLLVAGIVSVLLGGIVMKKMVTIKV
jgi:tight adherence protein B